MSTEGITASVVLSVISFGLGFYLRWFITVVKLTNDNLNNYINSIDQTLVEMQNSIVDYLSLKKEDAELKREPLRLLLVARCQNIYSICSKIKTLDKTNKMNLPNDTILALRQSCDAVFEDYEELQRNGALMKFEDSHQALAMFTTSSQKLLDNYMLQTPSIFKF
jgi:hypothetical protein